MGFNLSTKNQNETKNAVKNNTRKLSKRIKTNKKERDEDYLNAITNGLKKLSETSVKKKITDKEIIKKNLTLIINLKANGISYDVIHAFLTETGGFVISKMTFKKYVYELKTDELRMGKAIGVCKKCDGKIQMKTERDTNGKPVVWVECKTCSMETSAKCNICGNDVKYVADKNNQGEVIKIIMQCRTCMKNLETINVCLDHMKP